MAIARKCDRCGAYYDGTFGRITVESRDPEFVDEYYDLCRECKYELDDFINGVKPKNLLDRLLAISKLGKE